MMMKGFILIFALMVTLIPDSFALEIDEKLTLRLLKVSVSKKTVLINRGLEDGLVVGDHAKFFLTTGVIARGVVVKASPSRSIWSVYRRVAPEHIVTDKVLNLKISTPVKLTEDKTRMLTPEPTIVPMADESNIPLAPGADDFSDEVVTTSDQKELESLGETARMRSMGGVFVNRNWEFFVNLHQLDNFGTSTDDGNSTSDGSTFDLDMTLGLERYMSGGPKDFLSSFSFALLFNYDYSSSGNDSAKVSTTLMELGGAAHWHFGNHPHSFEKWIWYVSGMFGIGQQSTSTDTGNTDNDQSTNFFGVGINGKYFIREAFGVRLGIEYLRRGYTYQSQNNETTTVVSGFRYFVGFGYRF